MNFFCILSTFDKHDKTLAKFKKILYMGMMGFWATFNFRKFMLIKSSCLSKVDNIKKIKIQPSFTFRWMRLEACMLLDESAVTNMVKKLCNQEHPY